MNPLDWILTPFQYGFMRTAALAGALVGATCALLGVYVVLRRMAFIGDALAHTVLPGLVIAYLNRWNMTAGALVAGIITGRRLVNSEAVAAGTISSALVSTTPTARIAPTTASAISNSKT